MSRWIAMVSKHIAQAALLCAGAFGACWAQVPAAAHAAPVKPNFAAQKAQLAQVPVPSVMGMELGQAQQLLQKEGFASEPQALSPAGGRRMVRRMSPAAGTAVPSIARPVVKLYHSGVPVPPQPPGAAGAGPGGAAEAVRPMPNLVGMACGDAQSRIAQLLHAQLVCGKGGSSGKVPAGTINRQSPDPGTPVVLSSGLQYRAWIEATTVAPPPQAIVPDVRGLTATEADRSLRGKGLTARLQGSADVRGRQVAAQSVAPGTPVPPGTEVALTLVLRVPTLLGLDCERAREVAREAGFDDLRCEPRLAGAGQPLHRVFEQTPPAGSIVPTPRQLQAASAQPVPVPNVVGMRLVDALTALGNIPLVGRPDATDGDRQVKSQHPGWTAEAAPGSEVALATDLYMAVPKVEGLALSAAQDRLRGRGFDVRADHTDRVGARKVDTQSPAPDARVLASTVVELTTHVEVRVPHVVGLWLPEANTRLGGSGLNGKPDRNDNQDDRQVREQQPAPDTFVPERTAVSLTTVRMIKALPPMERKTCSEARDAGRQAGVAIRCEVKSPLPLVLGEPIVMEEPSVAMPVEENTVVVLKAVPPWWSMPSLLAFTLSATGGLGWTGRKVYRLVFPDPVPPGPAPPKPVAPVVTLRIAPDTNPSISVRFADGADWHGPHGPRLAWCLAPDEPRVCVRGLQDLSGVIDEQQR
ncbi:PASTA domain-containing protein [Variovorax sp. KK3]|uniref:PASTA domain-containing protein n=1 Tax=Variovorax sp. KK3 TaxID=1855728 RepID=UPI00097C4BDA|nr:PASTA domain-containing protein [Variovorax sp. KK3]